ncbi:MAG: phenylalanine--tRNA ligase beta subunit-related protein [Candidatus Woesearchaeota archaeon]
MQTTEEMKREYPGALVIRKTVGLIGRIDRCNPLLEQAKREAEQEIRQKFKSLEDYRIRAYQKFYKSLGLDESHMRSQIKGIIKGKEMPVLSTLIDSLVIPELKYCILIGGHDKAKVKGEMTACIAGENERYMGIGNRELTIPKGDIIVRDEESIIASITMGPSERTKLGTDTKQAEILAWTVPGIGKEVAELALEECEENIKRFCSQ